MLILKALNYSTFLSKFFPKKKKQKQKKKKQTNKQNKKDLYIWFGYRYVLKIFLDEGVKKWKDRKF